jgi:intracellular sulfur oxidation DsrE/DsrF family protein
MNQENPKLSLARRLFLGRLGMGAGVVGAAVAGSSVAMAQVAGSGGWRPARHEQDDWLEQIPGKHRYVFDTSLPDALGMALQFGNNYYNVNQQAYGLQDNDLAVVIVARHKSTSFGYNDALWAKYGEQFSQHTLFMDPATNQAPRVNVYMNARQSGDINQAGRMAELLKRGLHLAVCATASRGIAGIIARATGGDVDKILEEMRANLVPNARLVPAGIVAVNRAQERGYSFVHAR